VFSVPRGRKALGSGKGIEQYKHVGAERANNPPVGLVSPENDPVEPRRVYQYDPHLDPQLVWAGKAERTSFDVDTVSLHVHERIDPRTIIEAVRKKKPQQQLASFFETAGERPPLRDAVEFYRHSHGWSNRLIAGDSLLVMNSLLQKEGMAGKVQMIYIDPPYGIKYGSNFQPFVNKRDVKDGKDEDLTQEPEMIKAFRDTWELGIHSYITYLRDRLLLACELLTESGSVFVQISDENIHHVKELMDEIFDSVNFCGLIPFVKTTGQTSKLLSPVCDYLIWYAKNKKVIKYRELYTERPYGKESLISGNYRWVELNNGERRKLTLNELEKPESLPSSGKIFALSGTSSQTRGSETPPEFLFEGKSFKPETSRGWSTSVTGLEQLKKEKRLYALGNTLRYVRFFNDFPYQPLRGLWTDTGISGYTSDKKYVVQTNVKVPERCILMTTDPGDLVLDPTCGGGTTAYVAEQWGRRWITCDTSRVAITLAKERIMTALFDYYAIRNPKEGVGSGFNYKTIPHITLKSIANMEPPESVELYDRPTVDKNKVRVTGPFTVEAVPAPYVIPVGESPPSQEADISIARSGETRRLGDWRSELFKTGIRAKNGAIIQFTRVETLQGARWLHADAETKEADPKRVVISFGPDYAPLEQKQVEKALEEATHLFPRPKMVIFAAFQFDPEAAKDIDEAKTGMLLHKVQMNTDLLTHDLKKKPSNQSFWLIGQPDISVEKVGSGPEAGKTVVTVNGFDYYDPRTDKIESGGSSNIAIWMLDPDYDGRSLYPRQVFFSMADTDEGWSRLARNLKAEIDPELIQQYHRKKSLPFTPGDQIAVKIVDDRGIESLKIIRVS
jgi:adenine-specific DNA-methyltransferase